jgi:hypothetical protein
MSFFPQPAKSPDTQTTSSRHYYLGISSGGGTDLLPQAFANPESYHSTNSFSRNKERLVSCHDSPPFPRTAHGFPSQAVPKNLLFFPAAIRSLTHLLGCGPWDQVLGEHSSPLISGFLRFMGEHSIFVRCGVFDKWF